MKRRANHHSCKRGKRVFIKLADGSEFIDKYVEDRSRFIMFETMGMISKDSVIVFKIYKGQAVAT